ncbi:hypothetical protein [uncultured Finegoldia sp.]|uniref:hypothetical protein n=1 Tax=uncultured Finegoldia sp. TaxID=328009 RepID=UPI00262167DB|nr:hypothetical protein [uncultured Finegoldia sp.]
MKKKTVKLYNLIFPVWALWLFPITWIAIVPANILVDFLVSLLALKLIKVQKPMDVIKKSLAKTVVLGFVADIIPTAVLMTISFGINETRNSFSKWFYNNISIPVLNDYYETPWGILVMVMAVIFAGFLVYYFNRRFSFRNTDLTESQIKKVSMILAIITAPYLFLLPTGLFYNLLN